MRGSVLIGRVPVRRQLDLSWAAGAYSKDGVSGTFTGLGGTFTGSPTVNGSGITITGTQRARMPYSFPDTDFVVVIEGNDTGSGGYALAAQMFDPFLGDAAALSLVSGARGARFNGLSSGPSSAQIFQSLSTPFKAAFGIQGGVPVMSVNGAAVMTGATTGSTLDFSSGAVFDLGDGGGPWGQPLTRTRVLPGVYSYAEIQAL